MLPYYVEPEYWEEGYAVGDATPETWTDIPAASGIWTDVPDTSEIWTEVA
jgi:hypothetical protein